MKMSIVAIVGVVALAILVAVWQITGKPAPIIFGTPLVAVVVIAITASLKNRSQR